MLGRELKGTMAEQAQRLGPWFHNLELPDGTPTAPHHPLGDFPRFKWEEIAPHIPKDLHGWSVLDIGCNAGYYSFQLARRGAQVTGIDLDPRYLAQAEWASRQYGLQHRVEFRAAQIYDLASEPQTYDLVLFMGVLYHLRYPMLGLDIVAQKARRLMVFQTMLAPEEQVREDTHVDRDIHDRDALVEPGWPRLSFIEHTFAGDASNWWVANRAGVEAMLRSAGLKVRQRISDETYLCEPDAEKPGCVATWNRSEFLAATGQDWREAARNKVRVEPGTLESRRR